MNEITYLIKKKLYKKFIEKDKYSFIFITKFIIIFYLSLYLNNNNINFKNIGLNHKIYKLIENKFKKEGKININEAEIMIKRLKKINKGNIYSTIHIGFTLDKGFILQTMLTVASIMATQKKTTKIIFHFGVINNFTTENMIKMYQLKRRINNLTEFNFYYLKDSIKKMKNFHKKGEACPGKFELPELLPDNVERLLLFDAGDVLIFRDLTELYNYDMKDYWVLGTPEPFGIYLNYKIYNLTKYLNIGSILLNVKKLKENNVWKVYIKNRHLKMKGKPDQTLFNIVVPDNKKDYFPLRFGGLIPFINDRDSDKLKFHDNSFEKWLNSPFSKSFPENPNNLFKFTAQLYNPTFIHQWIGKWASGRGLSIYRNLAKYFIKLAGIWDEICKIKPGYCK
jgi:hypothetical protein